jgi:hypothetical protein
VGLRRENRQELSGLIKTHHSSLCVIWKTIWRYRIDEQNKD